MHAQIPPKSMVLAIVFVHAIISACDAVCPSVHVVRVSVRTSFLSQIQSRTFVKKVAVFVDFGFPLRIGLQSCFVSFSGQCPTICGPFLAASARFWGGLDVYKYFSGP